MSRPAFRPRFEQQVRCDAPEALRRLQASLRAPDVSYTAQVAGPHLHLRVARPARRLWSPFLNVELVPHPEGTLLQGHFGPHPDVWTFLVALYAMLGFAVLVGLIFGASQWMLGMPPVALWAVPAGLVLSGVLYGLARMGQHLSQAQMDGLRQFVSDATATPQPAAPVPSA